MTPFLFAGALALSMTVGLSPAIAQVDKFQVTPEEHAACDDDAARLCSDAYPDEDKLLECMKARHDQLTPTCSASFRAGLRKRHIRL